MGHGDHSIFQSLEVLGWEGLGFKDSVYDTVYRRGLKCKSGTFLGFWLIAEGTRGLFLSRICLFLNFPTISYDTASPRIGGILYYQEIILLRQFVSTAGRR